MEAFPISALIAANAQMVLGYIEALRKDSLSMGIYRLPAGGVDPQKPHTEDEVYFVLTGRGSIQVGEEHSTVEPGTIVFVDKGVDHRFHAITEDLTLLVFFAPAEYSKAEKALAE